MGLLLLTTFCISIFIFLPPCSCLLHQPHLLSPHEQEAVLQRLQALLMSQVPRKLLPIKVPMAKAAMDEAPATPASDKQYSMVKDHTVTNHQGSPPRKSVLGRKKKETGGEIITKDDGLLQLLNMDYSKVRRRQPIHNRAMPGAP